jgi:excisionase family DNA binding protein
MQKELLTAKQVASLLGIKPVTVYAWVKQRRLPHVVISIGSKGREYVRFEPAVIDEWVQERTRPVRHGFSKWDRR